MQAAVGFDHFVYGGVFFVIILSLLFVIGHYMSDPLNEIEKLAPKSNKPAIQKLPSLLFIIITLLLLLIGPTLKFKYESFINSLISEQVNKPSEQPSKVTNTTTKFSHNWIPSYPDADAIYTSALVSPLTSHNIDIFVAKYNFETDSKEIISYRNRLFDTDYWSIKGITSNKLSTKNGKVIPYSTFIIVNMKGEQRKVRVVYKVNGMLSANKVEFKLLQLMNKIMMTDFGGEVIVLSSASKHDADKQLDKFMSQNFSEIKQHLTLLQ